VSHLRTTPASALRSSPFLTPIFSTVPCSCSTPASALRSSRFLTPIFSTVPCCHLLSLVPCCHYFFDCPVLSPSKSWADSLTRIHWRRGHLGVLVCGNFEREKRDDYRRLDVRCNWLEITGSKPGCLRLSKDCPKTRSAPDRGGNGEPAATSEPISGVSHGIGARRPAKMVIACLRMQLRVWRKPIKEWIRQRGWFQAFDPTGQPALKRLVDSIAPLVEPRPKDNKQKCQCRDQHRH